VEEQGSMGVEWKWERWSGLESKREKEVFFF
jgi:hypothetical protein